MAAGAPAVSKPQPYGRGGCQRTGFWGAGKLDKAIGRLFGDRYGKVIKDISGRRIARNARTTARRGSRIRPGWLDRRHDWEDKQVGFGRWRSGISGAARKISRDIPSFSRAQAGGSFGIGRRHMGGVGNTQLPSGVDAYGFGQQWRDKRRRRDRASFASRCCQGKRSCPWVQIRFRRPRSRRTSVRDSCRSERLPRTVEGDEVMIVCRVSGSDHRHARLRSRAAAAPNRCLRYEPA
jgi:hypothetical protein